MMQFDSVNAFLHMGGHGLFVWSAYGITTVVMLWLLLAPLYRSRALLRQVHRQRAHSQNVSEQATADQSRSQRSEAQH